MPRFPGPTLGLLSLHIQGGAPESALKHSPGDSEPLPGLGVPGLENL